MVDSVYNPRSLIQVFFFLWKQRIKPNLSLIHWFWTIFVLQYTLILVFVGVCINLYYSELMNPRLMKQKPIYSRRNSLNIMSSTYLMKFVSKIVKIHLNIWYLNWQIFNFRRHITPRRNVFSGLIFWGVAS